MIKFTERRGAVGLEFLLVFSFILIGFLIIFSLELFVVVRMTEAFGVWRVARVSSIINWENTVIARNRGDLSIEPSSDKRASQNEKFGDALANSLESAWNISFLKNLKPNSVNQPPVEVNIQYNSGVLKNLLKIESDNFYWKCPNMPKGLNEHQHDVFGN